MSIPVIAFFNNKGGVGKTSLAYHLAWMYVDMGLRVVAADLDPQANLTSAFLDEDRLIELWPEGDHPDTIFGCIRPIQRGISDIGNPHLEIIDTSLALLAGDLLLMPLAQEAHKPIFYLKPADGAMGSHMHSVQSAYTDFQALAQKIIEKTDL